MPGFPNTRILDLQKEGDSRLAHISVAYTSESRGKILPILPQAWPFIGMHGLVLDTFWLDEQRGSARVNSQSRF